jgi:hypothetical protein
MMTGGTVVIDVISTFFLAAADADEAVAAESVAMPAKKADVDRPAARMRPAPAT